MTWDPDIYPTKIRAEIHDYDELQNEVVRAAMGIEVAFILDLGVGTGETASRVLQLHPEARLMGVDSSPEMLRGASKNLPKDRVNLLQQDLSAPLPDQTFDLVVSALAIHHLKSEGKATLFQDVRRHLRSGGRFAVGDVIVPEDPSDVSIENEPGYDFPDRIDYQLRWLAQAGFSAELVWSRKDLAVLKAEVLDT